MYESLIVTMRDGFDINNPPRDCAERCTQAAIWTVKVRGDGSMHYREWNCCKQHARSKMDEFTKSYLL
jgi:hypothetical protein